MKLIDKDAAIAEIEKRIAEYKDMKIDSSYYEGMVASLEFFRDEFINTLEVKEVDLEKYYHDFLQKEWFDKICIRTMSEMMAFTAKHFFELGLSVNNPITASDRGMAEEIIVNLKRVEQDYRIDLTREMEWLRNKVKKGEEV